MDSLLVKLNDSGLYTQGYADDICILVEGMFIPVICELMQRAVNVVSRLVSAERTLCEPTQEYNCPVYQQKKHP